jgi:hypothetical protein
MPKFAVYFTPRAEDPFYQLGSQILGYDVRRRQAVKMPTSVSAGLGEFDSAWVGKSRRFGFHLTVGDALDCDLATIPAVEERLADLLACFNPASSLTLQRSSEKPVGIWPSGEAYCLALLYQPNVTLAMLHALLVGCINPLGKGSVYVRQYLTGERSFQPHAAQQVRLFSSPTILDNWTPHFTLLNPYSGADAAAMATRLALLAQGFPTVTIESLCLLVQEDHETDWFIYRELDLNPGIR